MRGWRQLPPTSQDFRPTGLGHGPRARARAEHAQATRAHGYRLSHGERRPASRQPRLRWRVSGGQGRPMILPGKIASISRGRIFGFYFISPTPHFRRRPQIAAYSPAVIYFISRSPPIPLVPVRAGYAFKSLSRLSGLFAGQPPYTAISAIWPKCRRPCRLPFIITIYEYAE